MRIKKIEYNETLNTKKTIKYILIVLFILLLIVLIKWAAWPSHSPYWTGFGESKMQNGINPNKTLWDWLDLLLIPLIITLTGWYISRSEKNNDIAREKEKNQQNIRENYLKIITSLLLEHNLQNSEEGDVVRSVAKAHTTTFLRNADNTRRGIILQFLYESDLISENPIIDLLGVKLNSCHFDKIKLINIEITGAYFRECSFVKSNLENSIFCASNFSGSNLSYSNLKNVDFTYCDMIDTEIIGVDLRQAKIEGVDFTNANLKESTISKKQYDELKSKKFNINPKIIQYE